MAQFNRRVFTSEQKMKYIAYKEMSRAKNVRAHLPRANDSTYTHAQIAAHLPPMLRDKSLHHIGVSLNDPDMLIVVFTDGTQTNLNF